MDFVSLWLTPLKRPPYVQYMALPVRYVSADENLRVCVGQGALQNKYSS